MATVTLDTFYPHISLEASGASSPLMDQAIVSAAIELCEKALIWRQVLDPIGIAPNVADYDVAVPAGAKLADVLDAGLASGGWLDPRNLGMVQAERAAYAGVPPRTGQARGFLLTDPEEGTITIDPVPIAADVVTLLAALKPARSATSLPNFLYERWVEAIAAGAKFRLLRMPDQPWTDADTAIFYQNDFNQRISVAANRAARANTRMPLRSRTVSKLG